MYKLLKDISTNQVFGVLKDGITSIPFIVGNTDYAHFKHEINADEAQLEDADGNLMTAEQAKAYVKELP